MSKITDIIGELNKDPKLTTFNRTDSGEIKDWYPTLIPVFDYNMVGGVPASGRVSQAFGKPSSGKSTFSGNIMKNAIKMGAIVVYFDLEGTQNNSRLEALGVDTSKVLTYTTTRKKDGTMQELSIEEIGKTIIDTLAKVYEADPNQQVLFIWDSVAISDSEMQTNTELGNQVVGQQAKALATVGRK